jgi:hypothetical protein
MNDEFKKRYNAAKAHRRDYIDSAGREAYKFCFNGREIEWNTSTRRDDVPEEIFTDFPATVAEDFCGELFSTMTPENAPWVSYEAGNAVKEEDVARATEQLGELEKIMAKAIRASNYYDEGPTAFQDAVVGTVAMWVDRPTLNGKVVCEAVPVPELYLRLGPLGIDDRFRVRRYAYSDLEALFPDAVWPRDMRTRLKSNQTAKVVWGYWRDYEDPENPTWHKCVRVDDKEIGLDGNIGEDGAVPLVVGRFNPVPGSAWGRGPGVRMLPTLRVLNEITRMNMEGMDRNLDPALVYVHDGMLDLSQGIENGLGYPAMPGSVDSIREIGTGGALDYGFFSEERLQEQVRDGFYREMIQRGKTPPSASQYVGQEQKQLRRIARPGTKLWREFGVGLLKRVEYLERQPGGMLEGVAIPLIDTGMVTARPISPLERAQAREDVLVAQSVMGMATEALGEQAQLLIDGPKTMTNIKGALKDRLVEFRTEEQIMKIMQSMQPQEAPVAQPPAQ